MSRRNRNKSKIFDNNYFCEKWKRERERERERENRIETHDEKGKEEVRTDRQRSISDTSQIKKKKNFFREQIRNRRMFVWDA